MEEIQNNDEKRSPIPFILSGLSFIPLCGVIFGIISILFGIASKKYRILILIGILGIGLTVGLYAGLNYFGFEQRGGVYDDLRIQLSQQSLNTIIPWVELYQDELGDYPPDLGSLAEFMPEEQGVYLIDASSVDSNSTFPTSFYYERSEDGDGYFLLGLGQDGEPFTPDDILPTVDFSSTGFRIHPGSVTE